MATKKGSKRNVKSEEIVLTFGMPGFWHSIKPYNYGNMTGDVKKYWDNFIESTPKTQKLNG